MRKIKQIALFWALLGIFQMVLRGLCAQRILAEQSDDLYYLHARCLSLGEEMKVGSEGFLRRQ